MAATALIVFREVLEAALIVSIVLAAMQGVAARGRWVTTGVVAGLIGAAVLATLAGRVASAAAGMGQEYLNASILSAAVVMLGWHNVWMARHGRELKERLTALGGAVITGARPLYAVAIVVGLAVLREGSEVVLFLYGIAAAGAGQAGAMLAGGVLGLAGGVAVGAALYLGLLRIPMRHLFTVTSGLILLLAAGLAAQAAGYLVQADALPPLGRALWDTSHVLSERSIVGQMLHTLVGYIARPAGVQILFYLVTLVVIGGLMRLLRRGSAPPRTLSALFVLGTAAALAFTAPSREAHAADQVYLPFVEKGELEIEHRGHADFDTEKEQNYRVSVGYGVTDFWFFEVEGEYEKEPGEEINFEATEFENVLQLTPRGKYWADFGAFFEYELADDEDAPDEVKFGPIVSKSFGRMQVTLNPFFVKEIFGKERKDLEFTYSVQARYRLMKIFEPGVEAFGDPGEISGFDAISEQKHQIGPVAFGEIKLGDTGQYGAISYEIGLLFGLTDGSPDETLKWALEYEYHF